MRPDCRTKGLTLFLGGLSHREIAKKLGIARSTISRWSVNDTWTQKREEARLSAISDVKAQAYQSTTLLLQTAHSQTQALLEAALCELSAYQKGKLSRRQLKFKVSEIASLAKAVKECHPESTEGFDEEAKT